LPVVPPVVAPGVLNDLAIALQVPDLSARSWDRLLSIYEYLYGEEQNRDTVIQCLVQIAGALIEPVCAAIREEPGLRPCESFFVQTVKTWSPQVKGTTGEGLSASQSNASGSSVESTRPAAAMESHPQGAAGSTPKGEHPPVSNDRGICFS
jgi:hypothetical protein